MFGERLFIFETETVQAMYRDAISVAQGVMVKDAECMLQVAQVRQALALELSARGFPVE